MSRCESREKTSFSIVSLAVRTFTQALFCSQRKSIRLNCFAPSSPKSAWSSSPFPYSSRKTMWKPCLGKFLLRLVAPRMRIPHETWNSSFVSSGYICSRSASRSHSRPFLSAFTYIPLLASNRSFGSITMEAVRMPLVNPFMRWAIAAESPVTALFMPVSLLLMFIVSAFSKPAFGG